MSEKKVFTKENIKAFTVLVIIAVISATLLAVLSGVLYVSEEEKDQRALLKVYDSPATKITLVEEFAVNGDYGEVQSVFKTEDGNYIFKAKGNGGYQSGWMLCYIVVSKSGEILNVVVSENKDQSLAGNVKKKYLTATYVGLNIVSRSYFVVGQAETEISPVSGATLSSKAVANSFNVTKYYIENSGVLEAEE